MAVCSVCKKDTYRYRVAEDGSIRCLKTCVTASRMGRRLSTFPFTTTNLSDRPGEEVVVNNLSHLRRLEAQHGTQSWAYNMNNPEGDHRPRQREQP